MKKLTVVMLFAIFSVSLSGCAGRRYVVNNDPNVQIIERPGLLESVGKMALTLAIIPVHLVSGLSDVLLGDVRAVNTSQPAVTQTFQAPETSVIYTPVGYGNSCVGYGCGGGGVVYNSGYNRRGRHH